jgi:erythromycin esterase-like protein
VRQRNSAATATATANVDLAEAIGLHCLPIEHADTDYDPLLDLADDARFVLLGEATHGTHEFYSERARITRRLIKEKGFVAVAVEADWPDAYRVNRYVRGIGEDATAIEALAGFKRFPTWMWRNADVLDFVGWMRDYNASQPSSATQVGFYGLDLYSLYASIEAVLKYLDKVDPEAAKRARYRYGCFEHFGEDSQAYGYAAGFGITEPCRDEVISQLLELQRRAPEYASLDGKLAEDEFFHAQQNARVVKNAEEYYRTMFEGKVSSWNLRDRHMAETLEALADHLDRHTSGGRSKIVVWAHNSHLGDARATYMGRMGEWNIGQLVREKYGREALLVGFSTYEGTVTAASDWDGPVERKQVRPALRGSYEELFHRSGTPDFMLILKAENEAIEGLREEKLERAIGVIYRPETERISHFFEARIPDQFDIIIHFDQTRAVKPLEHTTGWEKASHPRPSRPRCKD